jgi:2,4-dienoyl-CoA reductase-like NADH-dependent reductase (Old Yellow Enzyme family)
MCQYSCDNRDGMASDWHLVHLGGFAKGGAALIIAEATGVAPEGRISPYDTGLWHDDQIEPWARTVRFIHSQGALAGIQLAHAGRKASTNRPWSGGKPLGTQEGGWQPVGPSDQPFADGYPTPRRLTTDEVAALPDAWAAAAHRADVAGFDVVEIHGAHGYLQHSFLSPITNDRDDRYGGDFEGRTRLMRETVTAIRAVWPASKPLFVRLSSTDWIDGGWNDDDTVRLSRNLAELGADVIDCSSGGVAPHQQVVAAPLYQVPFAARVRHEASIASMAVGLITTALQANAVVADGHADLVALGRELLRDPHFPVRAAKELGAPPPQPAQYLRA